MSTMTAPEIPFYKAHLTGREIEYVTAAITGGALAGNGPFTKRATDLLAGLTGASVVLTSSGTDALELAVTALGLEPGDEVIVPSYTFVSTASCLLQAGLVPVFADVRLDTANLDERRFEEAIGPRTRAVIPVHYAGVAVEMDGLMDVARRRGLVVVEDACHAVGARYQGKPLGAVGAMGVFSFHQSKNVTSGEGGALVVSDRTYWKAVEVHHEIGTDRARFLRGEIPQYSWIDRGSNYLMSDVLAGVLLAQLESLDAINSTRARLYGTYRKALEPHARAGRLQLAEIPDGCESNFHFFHFLLPTPHERDAMRQHLHARGIGAAVHYSALHRTAGGTRFGVVRSSLACAERVADCVLRLPFFTDLTDGEQQRVIETVDDYFRR